jgi:hypothetical protein
MYVLGGVLGILMGSIHIGGTSLHGWIYGWLCGIFPDIFASLLYALLFVGLNWCIGYPLYKKRIYIQI